MGMTFKKLQKTRCSRDIEKYYSSFKTLRLKSMNFKSLSRNGIKRFIHIIIIMVESKANRNEIPSLRINLTDFGASGGKIRFCYADVTSRQKLLYLEYSHMFGQASGFCVLFNRFCFVARASKNNNKRAF